MNEPQFATFKQVALQQLKVACRRVLSAELPFVAGTARFDVSMMEWISRDLMLDVQARVLAEQLPPQEITHHVRVWTTDPRHATWWDHFKATYRGRWWMGWHRWEIRYVDTPVWLDRRVTVAVRDHWTYPRATVGLPPSLGSPVLVTMWDAADEAWRRS